MTPPSSDLLLPKEVKAVERLDVKVEGVVVNAVGLLLRGQQLVGEDGELRANQPNAAAAAGTGQVHSPDHRSDFNHTMTGLHKRPSSAIVG